jgi:hypothetical protein
VSEDIPLSYVSKCRHANTILFVKAEGNRPLGRTRRRWEDNIRMSLTEI